MQNLNQNRADLPVGLYDPACRIVFKYVNKTNTRKCNYRSVSFKSIDAEIINKV